MVADDDSCGMLKGSSSSGGLSRCCCRRYCCCARTAPPRSSIAIATIAARLHARPAILRHRSVATVGDDSRVDVALGRHRRALSPSQGFARARGRTRSRGSAPGEGYVVAEERFGAESRCARAGAALR